MKKKVLLVTVDYRWYAEAIQNAFIELNWDVYMINTHIGIKKSDIIRRIALLLGYNSARYIERNRKKISNKIKYEFDKYAPDLVYITQGTQVTADIIEYFKSNAKTILYVGDSIERMEHTRSIAAFFDYVFTYEKSEVDIYAKYGVKAIWMPGVYAPSQYYPLNLKRDIDLSFVGLLLSDRKIVIEKLVTDMPDIRFEIWGECVKINHPFQYLKWYFFWRKKGFRNRNIHYTKVNEVYNRSKICLNLNNTQARTCWSSRLPEILGTKTFQITNALSCIEDIFNQEVVCFDTIEQLESKIRYYLNNMEQAQEIASNGYQLVKNRYTYKAQISKIIDICEI